MVTVCRYKDLKVIIFNHLIINIMTQEIDLALERIPSRPPAIAPVPRGLERPQWSVMIPAYNCLAYLQGAIESVLAQAPNSEVMQITVVDDCSTDGDVAALVERVGQGRVDYYRQERNVGSLRNFETCLNQAVGHWVHLLHGDDRLVAGFYDEIQFLFHSYPDAGAAFTRSAFIIESDNKEELQADKTLAPKTGIINDFLLKMAEGIKLQPPSIVVRRDVYEQLGGFFGVHYGEDWEMWTRIAAKFPVAYSPKPLAHYRYLGGASITHRSIASGQNIKDIMKVIDTIQEYLPSSLRSRLKRVGRHNYAMYCASLANFLSKTDLAAATIQAKGALEMSNDIRVYLALKRFFLRNLLHFPK